jgi:heat shock protein HslJ
MRRMLLAVPLLVVLAACGQRPTNDPVGAPTPDPLRGKTFIATAVTEDGKPRPLVAEVSIQFTDDGRIIARGGCNMMQGQVDTSGGKIVIDGGLATTEMACAQELHDQDGFVAGVLSGAPSWQLSDDKLTITSGSTVVELAPRELVHPDRDLAGTTWVLDTIVDGQSASSVAAGAPPVTLLFDGSKVTADTGCNGVSADYTTEGDTITFDLAMMTKMACAPEIMQGENAVVDALAGKAKYEITADRLSLTGESGKGIQLHAQ